MQTEQWGEDPALSHGRTPVTGANLSWQRPGGCGQVSLCAAVTGELSFLAVKGKFASDFKLIQGILVKKKKS